MSHQTFLVQSCVSDAIRHKAVRCFFVAYTGARSNQSEHVYVDAVRVKQEILNRSYGFR